MSSSGEFNPPGLHRLGGFLFLREEVLRRSRMIRYLPFALRNADETVSTRLCRRWLYIDFAQRAAQLLQSLLFDSPDRLNRAVAEDRDDLLSVAGSLREGGLQYGESQINSLRFCEFSVVHES